MESDILWPLHNLIWVKKVTLNTSPLIVSATQYDWSFRIQRNTNTKTDSKIELYHKLWAVSSNLNVNCLHEQFNVLFPPWFSWCLATSYSANHWKISTDHRISSSSVWQWVSFIGVSSHENYGQTCYTYWKHIQTQLCCNKDVDEFLVVCVNRQIKRNQI